MALLQLTVPFSLVGFPALSLPCGEAEEFSVSAQLVMARGKDHELLGLGRWIGQQLA